MERKHRINIGLMVLMIIITMTGNAAQLNRAEEQQYNVVMARVENITAQDWCIPEEKRLINEETYRNLNHLQEEYTTLPNNRTKYVDEILEQFKKKVVDVNVDPVIPYPQFTKINGMIPIYDLTTKYCIGFANIKEATLLLTIMNDVNYKNKNPKYALVLKEMFEDPKVWKKLLLELQTLPNYPVNVMIEDIKIVPIYGSVRYPEANANIEYIDFGVENIKNLVREIVQMQMPVENNKLNNVQLFGALVCEPIRNRKIWNIMFKNMNLGKTYNTWISIEGLVRLGRDFAKLDKEDKDEGTLKNISTGYTLLLNKIGFRDSCEAKPSFLKKNGGVLIEMLRPLPLKG